MEKITDEMDMELEDWDFLSDDDGLLDLHPHEDGGKGVLVPKGVLDMDYFSFQSPDSHLLNNLSVSSDVKQVFQLDTKVLDEKIVKEVVKVPVLEKIEYRKWNEEDQTMIYQQLSFNKGNQFVDTILDSPRSGSRGIRSLTDEETVQFEDKKVDHQEHKAVKEADVVQVQVQEKNCSDSTVKEEIKWEGGGLNIWKWRISGTGALCSIGMAAATICIFIIGSQQKHKQFHQNQKLQFQIYADDKRFKNVIHHATKLNQAILSVSGVPSSNRAHFTYGGYYAHDGL